MAFVPLPEITSPAAFFFTQQMPLAVNMSFGARHFAALIILATVVLATVCKLLKLGQRDPGMPTGKLSPIQNLPAHSDSIPSGPPTKPIVGNEHLIPRNNAHIM